MRILASPVTAYRGPVARLSLRRYRLLSLANEAPCTSEPRLTPVGRGRASGASNAASESRIATVARPMAPTAPARRLSSDTLPSHGLPWVPGVVLTIESIPLDEWEKEAA